MENQYIYQVISLVLLILLAIFAIYLPDKKRKKQLKSSRDSMKIGDIVITKNGLKGRIQKVEEESIIMNVEPVGTRLEVAKWAVEQVNPQKEWKKR